MQTPRGKQTVPLMKWAAHLIFTLLGLIIGVYIGMGIGHAQEGHVSTSMKGMDRGNLQGASSSSEPEPCAIKDYHITDIANQVIRKTREVAPMVPAVAFSDPPPVVNSGSSSGGSKLSVDGRESLHLAWKKMKDRAAIPALLNDLGLVGESVEVGVRKGEYSKHILENWKGQKHHMVDPWEHQDEKIYKDISNRDDKWQNELYTNLAEHMASKHPGRHQLHRGYSVQVADADFQDDSLDFVYLDARHDYAGLKEDIEAWWPKLKLGGMLAGHDFVPDGNIHAGEFGVQRAVFEFAKNNHREFMSISDKEKDGGRSEPQHVDGGWTTWYLFK
jgi:hypothetical protein